MRDSGENAVDDFKPPQHFNTSKDTLCLAADNTEISPSGHTRGFDPAPIWTPLHKACPELPPVWPGLSERQQQELAESGITPEQACREGIFTATAKQAKELTGYSLPGLIFPYWKPQTKAEVIRYGSEGKPYCRIKPNWILAGEKARAAFRDDETEPLPKYLAPKDSGVRCYFSRHIDWSKAEKSAKLAMVTEGEKCAISAAVNGIITIGLSGVWNFRADEGLLGGARPWEWRGGKCKVIICFDSDIVSNEDVQGAAIGLAKAISIEAFEVDGEAATKLNKNLRFTLLPHELTGAKNGIDDFIYRHGADSLQRILSASLPLVLLEIKSDKRKKEAEPQLIFQSLFAPEPCGDGVNKHLPRHAQRNLRSVMLAEVAKDSFADQAGLAPFRYSVIDGTWKLIDKKIFQELPQKLADVMGWVNRTGSLLTEHLKQLELRARIEVEQWDNPRYLAFKNGVLDQETGELLPFSSRFKLTKALGFNYDPSAKCQRWESFLAETFPDDPFQILALQACFRWTLEPKDNRTKFGVEVIPALQGKPGRGKSVVLDVLNGLLGESSTTFDKQILEDSKERLPLIGKMAAVESDFKGGFSDIAVGFLNKVASNEPVSVRGMHKDGGPMRLGLLLWLAFNESPRISQNAKDGFGRRLLTFFFKYAPKEIDKELSAKLAAELPGIFNWAMSMSLDTALSTIQEAKTHESMQSGRMQHLADTNTVYGWLLDDAEMGFGPEDSMKLTELYQKYAQWAKDNGFHGFNRSNFKTELQKAGAEERRTNVNRFWFVPSVENIDTMALLGLPNAPKEEPTQDNTQEPDAQATAATPQPKLVDWVPKWLGFFVQAETLGQWQETRKLLKDEQYSAIFERADSDTRGKMRQFEAEHKKQQQQLELQT